MNLSTRQLRAFLHVAQSGSFTRAAERAHMTQAGLSILVREVELQLGARLFDRTTRAVQLTDAGRRLAVVAETVLQQLDEVTREVDALGQQSRQTLRIAATPLVSSHLLPHVLAHLRLTRPDLNVQLHDTSLDQVQTLVESGAADVGLGFFFKTATGLERRLVGEFPLMRVGPGTEAPQALGRVRWTALKGESLITLPADNPIQRFIDTHLARIDLQRPVLTTVSFLATQISMVEAGFGVAVVPTFALAACRRHRVRTDVLGSPQVKIGFYRISRRGVSQTDAIEAFDETLQQMLPAMSR
jgi:DNA-binding transcriptional LysR family regulator